MSRRRWLLAGLWGVIGCVVLFGGFLLVPRLLAQYYISKLVPYDSAGADAAFSRLKQMGRLAVPALLDAIDDRDPDLIDARKNKIPGYRSRDDLGVFQRARAASETESRADLCVAALLRLWEKGRLSETEKDRVRPYLTSASMHVPKSSFRADDFDIRFEALVHEYICSEIDWKTMSVLVEIVIRNSDGERVIPFSRLNQMSDLNRFGSVRLTSATLEKPGETQAAASLRVASIGAHWAIAPRTLGVGKHEIFLRIKSDQVSNAATADQRPSPWLEALTFGPLVIEITPAPPFVFRDPTAVEREDP